MTYSRKGKIPMNIWIIFMLLITCFSSAQTLSKSKKFSFERFELKDSSHFNFTRLSTIDRNALQLTPDNENQDNGYSNKSGRIAHRQQYKLWPSDSVGAGDGDVVASFNTFFVINLFRNKDWEAGEGLAFVISPNSSYVPEHSYGQWLGLTNATTDGNPENRIVAVEFDTRKQDFDPDGNHIGLNINSVYSNKTVPLAQSGIELSPASPANYGVWIDYNGTAKAIEVFIAKEGDGKPSTPVLNETLNLRHFVEQVSYFGFSGSTGDPGIQYNCVLKWNLEVEVFPRKRDQKWLIVGVSIGVPAMILLLILFGRKLRSVYLKKEKARDEESEFFGTLKRLPGMPREFKFRDLERATSDFHESMVLGKGGFGVVYRGVLRESDSRKSALGVETQVAVKRFSRESIDGKEDFLAELTIIHRLRHKYLVRLAGWCYEKGKLLLVYDYMPNGSVDKHLYNPTTTLQWRHRYKILAGVASALHYLHCEFDQKVVHRDLKASNILLDADFGPRLGDFGLARAIEAERSSYAELNLGGVPGTMGYVAPECFHTGKATPESDVFGFGAVVLEVVCGRNPGVRIQHGKSQYTLVDWVWMLHREGSVREAVDVRLEGEYDVDEAVRLLLLGLACSHPVAAERPQTSAVCSVIAEAMPPPFVPPFKPVFTWPSLSTTAAFSSADNGTDSSTLSNI